MEITNQYNLPEPLVSVVKNDPYPQEPDWDISTTTLITPPRIVQLRKRHRAKLIEDVADNIYRLIGTNTHHIIERIDTTQCLKEKRFTGHVLAWKIAGQIDLFELITGVLSDWKVTSVWSVINGLKPEHEQQLNINAYLMRQNGYKINKLQIVNLLRDWSKHQVKKSSNYPECQVAIQEARIWDKNEIRNFLEARVRLHQLAEETPSDKLLFCTPEERWEKPTKYAVMKKGRKSAVRLLESQEDAEKYIEDKNLDNKHYIDVRIGESTRCEHYCNVNQFCNQYQEMKCKKAA